MQAVGLRDFSGRAVTKRCHRAARLNPFRHTEYHPDRTIDQAARRRQYQQKRGQRDIVLIQSRSQQQYYHQNPDAKRHTADRSAAPAVMVPRQQINHSIIDIGSSDRYPRERIGNNPEVRTAAGTELYVRLVVVPAFWTVHRAFFLPLTGAQ